MTKYLVLKQYVPSNDPYNPIWASSHVYSAKINEDDTIDIFDTEAEAQAKATELKANDPSVRNYKVVPISDGELSKYL
jgi:hypothetical protein